MPLYIALFRGINVGGSNSLPMTDLVQILSDIGAKEIRTYLQSGNAVFSSTESNIDLLAEKICRQVEIRKGFLLKVLILTLEEFEQAIAENPYPQHTDDPSSLHLGFLAAPPISVDMEKLISLQSKNEEFTLTPKVFYFYAPDGVGRSRLAAGVEKVLVVTMTDRNWRTVCKIRDLIKDLHDQ